MRQALIVAFATLLSAPALAADVECPKPVDHVLLEEGHRTPFPTTIMPDVGAEDDTVPAEWNYLNNKPDLPELTVHCYFDHKEKEHADLQVPKTIRRCVLDLKKRFHCE